MLVWEKKVNTYGSQNRHIFSLSSNDFISIRVSQKRYEFSLTAFCWGPFLCGKGHHQLCLGAIISAKTKVSQTGRKNLHGEGRKKDREAFDDVLRVVLVRLLQRGERERELMQDSWNRL